MEIIKRDNVADAIYDALYQKIASGQWAEGDKIPNEFVLCEELGVSRVSVRSAIQRFVALGMLEVKRGYDRISRGAGIKGGAHGGRAS